MVEDSAHAPAVGEQAQPEHIVVGHACEEVFRNELRKGLEEGSLEVRGLSDHLVLQTGDVVHIVSVAAWKSI